MLDRRNFMKTCSGMGLAGTLLPGVLWAQAQAQGAAKITKEMIDNAASIADVAIAEDYKQMMLDNLNEHRRDVAARYNDRLEGVVQIPPERPWARAVYHMYVIRTQRRDELAEFLKGKGIGTGIHYPIPNHQQPATMKLYSDLPRLPKTEAAVNEILLLPIYGDLPMEDVDYVCDAIVEFFGKK